MRIIEIVAAVLLAGPAGAGAAETDSSTIFSETPSRIDAGGTFLAAPGGYLAGPGFELYAGNYSLELGADVLSYEYSESNYEEWGSGTIVNARGRYYPQSERALGLWVAGGLAAGTIEVEWEEWRSGTWVHGSERSAIVVPNFGVGYKFAFAGEKLTFDPQVLAGIVGGGETDTPFIAGAGVGVGLRF